VIWVSQNCDHRSMSERRVCARDRGRIVVCVLSRRKSQSGNVTGGWIQRRRDGASDGRVSSRPDGGFRL